MIQAKSDRHLVMSGSRCASYGSNHNHKNNLKHYHHNNRYHQKKHNGCHKKALWLPWPPALPDSKPLQIIWMVVPGPQGDNTEERLSPPINGNNGPGAPSSVTNNQQPPLIANPPNQPLIIPSHVANALLLTR